MVNKYYIIDIFKVIFAIFVVFLHTPSLFENANINLVLRSVYGVAVPMFFAFSGFFFFKTGSDLRKSIRRILILYLFWLILSFYMVIGQKFNLGLSAFQLIRQFVFSSSFNVSWYLVALIWCIIITGITKKLGAYFQICLAILLYIMCISDLVFFQLIKNTWLETINSNYKIVFGTIAWSFPHGLLFFIIGYFLGRFEANGIVVNKRVVLPLLFLAIIIGAIEIYYSSQSMKIVEPYGFIAMPLFVLTALATMLSFSGTIVEIVSGRLLRNLSTLLYLSHPIIKAVWIKFFGPDGLNGLIFLILVFCAMSYLIFKLEKYKSFNWLKYSY